MTNTNFKPADYVGWARNMIGLVRDGGVWALPVNRTAYRFDHVHQTLTLVAGPIDEHFDRTRAVFGLLGYATEAAPEETRTTFDAVTHAASLEGQSATFIL